MATARFASDLAKPSVHVDAPFTVLEPATELVCIEIKRSALFLFAKKVAKAIGNIIPCQKVGLTVIGLEVRHAHIHLIPINSIYDMDFKREKLKFEKEEFVEIAAIISKEFNKL